MNHEKSKVEPFRKKKLDDFVASARRAISEFLSIPILVVFAFLLLALGSDFLDRSRLPWILEIRHGIQSHIFGKAQGTRDLMGSIASGIITMTSITISVLLVAVQQSSANLTPLIFDQFLRRRQNQVYFGYFVGLATYVLVILASVHEPFVPVLGATATLFLTLGALMIMVLLLYSTINQMRPAQIIEAIHDYALNAARKRERLLTATRRKSVYGLGHRRELRASRDGFVTRLDLRLIRAYYARPENGRRSEITYSVSVGTYVAFNDKVGEVQCDSAEQLDRLQWVASQALHLQDQRDLTVDPAFAIEQLQTIAWASISSAKQNQHPGLLCIRSLRDLLARWGEAKDSAEMKCVKESEQTLPVVYNDRLMESLLDSFEALAAITSESLQEQCFTEVLISICACFPRMMESIQERLTDVVLRMLSSLGDHVLTLPLEQQLLKVRDVLARGGRAMTAEAVDQALRKMKTTVGHLGSRATRAA